MEIRKKHRTHQGWLEYRTHQSDSTQTKMNFATFNPDGEIRGALIWLSGLTCTEENFVTKAGAFQRASEKGLVIVAPDTSPRGLDLPSEHESYDFGSGAGFYLDALSDGYRDHYKMESYIMKDLYPWVESEFKVGKRIAVSGHSMGGHGALTLGLNHAAQFCSISAFSPIVNPVNCPWGQKAFQGYLGEDQIKWKHYDTCEILNSGNRHSSKILIDQGMADEFLEEQLLTRNFENVAKEVGQEFEVRYQPDYDHSYFFITTFINDHIDFHTSQMN